MKNFIQITDTKKGVYLVNIDHIEYISPTDEGSKLKMRGGYVISTLIPYENIASFIVNGIEK